MRSRLWQHPERGSAVVLALAAVTVLVSVTVGLLLLGAAHTGSNRARAAADLAALSGAGQLLLGAGEDEACAAAVHVARRNGADVLSCTVEHVAAAPPRVTVVVGVAMPSLGDAQARARARAGGVPARG